MSNENANIINGVKMTFEKPPVWDNVCGAFGIQPVGAVFTYGDCIYNPNRLNLPQHIIEHEKVHMEQQNHNDVDAALWWGKYLRDPEFRVDQEARAYGVQYAFISKTAGRPQRRFYLKQLAKILSGKLYHEAIRYDEAVELIKLYAAEARQTAGDILPHDG